MDIISEDLVTYLFVLLAVYIAIGLCLATLVSYQDWRHGEDFLVADLLPWLWRMLLWPLGLAIMLEDISGRAIGDIVLIPGRRSAKLMKKLRED